MKNRRVVLVLRKVEGTTLWEVTNQDDFPIGTEEEMERFARNIFECEVEIQKEE